MRRFRSHQRSDEADAQLAALRALKAAKVRVRDPRLDADELCRVDAERAESLAHRLGRAEEAIDAIAERSHFPQTLLERGRAGSGEIGRERAGRERAQRQRQRAARRRPRSRTEAARALDRRRSVAAAQPVVEQLAALAEQPEVLQREDDWDAA